MSISFRPLDKISASDLFDGRLEGSGVCEVVNCNTTEQTKCLTDGTNYVWVYITRKGFIGRLTEYMGNEAKDILWAIADACGTDFVTELAPHDLCPD